MVTETRTILRFDEVGKDDVAVVGGKGANLGELLRFGIPVPPGFIVSAPTYRRFLEEAALIPTLRRLCADLDVEDSALLQSRAAEMRAAIENAPMPPDIATAIRDAYEALGGGPVAVRSSATAEDLPEASFAGQQATFLNVEGADRVVRAVQRCWASLFEARALFYRAQTGWDHLAVSLAVPVQRMVQAERSGVMFTIEPVQNDPDRIVIEAAYGLGEAVVSGEISPDHYEVVKKSLAVVTRHVVRQERQLRRRGGGGDGDANAWIALPLTEQDQPKLTTEQIQEIARVGLRVEQHYGSPQDIEWAWADGRLYILQARPVTTVGRAALPLDLPPRPEDEGEPLLVGAPASPGVAAGRVNVVLDPTDVSRVEQGDILVAAMTTPDFIPAMRRAAAIVTDRGGRTCHAAIVSRELGVPCIVGTDRATQALHVDDIVTVDGARGAVYAGRRDDLLGWWERARQRQDTSADLRTRTKIYVNLAEPELADVVAQRAVDGVGLLRAEFMIAQIGEHPRSFIKTGRAEEFVRRLEEGLRTFARAFTPRPVVYRATDFKTNEYANLRGGAEFETAEENPMLGYRGAARYVREPEVFALELAAIKRVRQDFRNLHLMIPFVRTTDELRRVKELIDAGGLQQGPDFKLWMMVEVPSNIFLLDQFIDLGIDGISIGSNDLTQLILGIDRDSERFAEQFDERDPAVLAALEIAVTTANRRGITVSICGQGPSEHLDLTERLVGWGITSVSVTPDMIDQTRRLVAEAEARQRS